MHDPLESTRLRQWYCCVKRTCASMFTSSQYMFSRSTFQFAMQPWQWTWIFLTHREYCSIMEIPFNDWNTDMFDLEIDFSRMNLALSMHSITEDYWTIQYRLYFGIHVQPTCTTHIFSIQKTYLEYVYDRHAFSLPKHCGRQLAS